MKRARLLVLLLVAAIVGTLALAGGASAAPGGYRVLIVSSDETDPLKLRNQLAAFPDVAVVEIRSVSANGELSPTPDAAQLGVYDLVVSGGEYGYLDKPGYGDALAGYVDSGGVVVQLAYDNWFENGESQGPTGRFESGGYLPFLPGDNPNQPVTLGEFDAANPLMQGVTALASVGNTEPTLAPGAALIAKWSDGRNLAASKGRVVSISAWLTDNSEWSGDFARLIVNVVRRVLGRQELRVTNANPAGGSVTSSVGGIACGAVCSAFFNPQTPVALTAQANSGFAFGGFSGACTGVACALTMDAPKAVTASFFAFQLRKKLSRNRRKGTGRLTVDVGGPGQLVITGRKVKKRATVATKAGKVALPILAKGRAAKALKSTGKVKVKLTVTFTPTDGVAASATTTALLLQRLGG